MLKYDTAKDQLLNIPISKLKVWDKHIKKNYDMNLDEMQKSLNTHGQTTPLVVRIAADNKFYEIIDGAERYYSALNLRKFKKLYCIVRSLSDKQALLLQAVNTDDKKISGYQRALAYRAALYEQSIKQKDLADKLDIACSTLTRRMSFLKIDQEFWDNIGDSNKITDAIANEIVVLINKNKKLKRLLHADLIKKLILICKGMPTLSGIKSLHNLIENKCEVEKTYFHDGNLIYKFDENVLAFNRKYIEKVNINSLLENIDLYLNKVFYN